MSNWKGRYPLRHLARFYKYFLMGATSLLITGLIFHNLRLLSISVAINILGLLSVNSLRAYRRRSRIKELLADIPTEAEWKEDD